MIDYMTSVCRSADCLCHDAGLQQAFCKCHFPLILKMSGVSLDYFFLASCEVTALSQRSLSFTDKLSSRPPVERTDCFSGGELRTAPWRRPEWRHCVAFYYISKPRRCVSADFRFQTLFSSLWFFFCCQKLRVSVKRRLTHLRGCDSSKESICLKEDLILNVFVN